MAHKRNTDAMRHSERCGALTRSRSRCKAPAVKGKKRCRMHGGATGSGAPMGNDNALTHGLYTAVMIESRRETYKALRSGYSFLRVQEGEL